MSNTRSKKLKTLTCTVFHPGKIYQRKRLCTVDHTRKGSVSNTLSIGTFKFSQNDSKEEILEDLSGFCDDKDIDISRHYVDVITGNQTSIESQKKLKPCYETSLLPDIFKKDMKLLLTK